MAFPEKAICSPQAKRRDREVTLAAGETDLILRAPEDVPRGGLHTHYALSIPATEYESWQTRLDQRFDIVERTFGDTRSLYFYDTAGNCVELGFEPVDWGDDRNRVRMTAGDLDIELWEPQLDIADARGGVHVDFGVRTDDAEATAERARRDALAVDELADGLRLRDPDGHYVTLVDSE